MTDDELREFVRAEVRHAMPAASGAVRAGNGAPNGVVAAPVGTLYRRRDGGAGTVLYVKESGGSGNTGWVAK